jgi:predicted dehydrogenase
METKRYAIAGLGSRGLLMFATPLLRDFAGRVELVAFFDQNRRRLENAQKALEQKIPIYTDFDKMLAEARPDGVIITTRDSTHAEFMIKALKAGKRAISEKPLCVSAAQCKEILSAARESGAEGLVTHNARYGPVSTEMKRWIKEGKLGTILRMQFDEHLDRVHGADYFRRWHRRKANSGGLLIHKACHHFDLLNWFAQSLPETVYAQGALRVYGKNGPFRSKRCRGCPHAEKCAYYVDLFQKERYRGLYLEAEAEDGYIRDGCVFDEEIDIEDQAAVVINYQNGILVSYTMCAYASYEGHRIVIEGTLGRLEQDSVSSTTWLAGPKRFQESPRTAGRKLMFYSPDGRYEEIEVKRVEGGHGGSDVLLREDIFGASKEDPLHHKAPLEEGIQAVLVGAAANQSIATGSPVKVQELMG